MMSTAPASLAPPLTVEPAAGQPTPDEKLFRMPGGDTKEFFYCQARQVLIEGPSRTAKTRTAVEKIYYLACLFPGTRALILRKTRESMTHSVMQTFKEEVLLKDGRVKWVDKDQAWLFPNGSSVVVAGLDTPSKALSTGWDMVYINQAEELEAEPGEQANAAYETLLTRLSEQHMPFRQILLDVNPSYPTHWINLWFPPASERPQGYCRGVERARFLSRHEDNPLWYDQKQKTWTSAGRQYMATLDQLTSFRRSRLRDGLWVSAEGQFFTEWDPAVHIVEPFEIPAFWTRWIGYDYGFAEPASIHWIARDPSPDAHGVRHDYVYREWYHAGYRDRQQAAEMRRLSRGERIVRRYADPSVFNRRTEQNKPSIASVFLDDRVPLTRASNNRVKGWQILRDALAWEPGSKPRLLVFRDRAPNLCRTLPMMVHDSLDSEDLADQIKGRKTEDHAVDGLRYALAGAGVRRVHVQRQEVNLAYAS